MKKYLASISFEDYKHCFRCPLRVAIDDSCALQKDLDVDTWEEQMENCPLVEEE